MSIENFENDSRVNAAPAACSFSGCLRACIPNFRGSSGFNKSSAFTLVRLCCAGQVDSSHALSDPSFHRPSGFLSQPLLLSCRRIDLGRRSKPAGILQILYSRTQIRRREVPRTDTPAVNRNPNQIARQGRRDFHRKNVLGAIQTSLNPMASHP